MNYFLSPNKYLCKFGGENPTGLEDRAQKRLILQFFKDGFVCFVASCLNEETLKIR